jgi:hypothetical protein
MVISFDIFTTVSHEGRGLQLRHRDYSRYSSLAEASLNYSARRVRVGWDVGPLAIALPSVVVPEWNVVLFPNHPEFWKRVKLITIEPFEYDPRLFPEGIPTEPAETF